MEHVLKIADEGKGYPLTCKENESIMNALLRQGIYVSAVCGGRGTCGKCRIQVVEGDLPVTPSDEKKLKKEELEAGFRLACKAVPQGDCTIRLHFQTDEAFNVVAGRESAAAREKAASGYAIAIDIGTTTLAMQLLDLDTGKAAGTYTGINHQRAYGSDVISRIQASNDGKKELLRKSICRDLLAGIRELTGSMGVERDQVKEIAIGGNTTMGHLLMGFSCEHLGIFPFRPVDISTIRRPFSEILKSDELDCDIVLLPGISTYVGGDITSGLLSCGFAENEKVCLLVDLGTNGEMAVGNRDKIFVTSTAAGPAFEGGNISWGMGSVAGAISNVKITDGKASVTTIQGAEPEGLCGTGVIETAAELVKAALVDETGLLDEEYFGEGFPLAEAVSGDTITFTQKDVREIQLAKAAVRAGMETLLLRYGVVYDQVDTLYLAGGFGFHIDQDKAIDIGLLPKAFEGRIKAVGNSSLSGAEQYILDEEAKQKVEHIIKISREVELSTDPDFNELYMDHMYFERDE
ncbi:ASKHA domain-containing protein [Murimonas intestini]|uniref:Uncharacterized 2Fe-2S/4Fe-4S cluster protein (DUF4445 family) n=1 Tax=Murimonas intestini TaxID=1337051 RepID=A0AB73SZF9_9FIRM|nr:ASKHA domain-containing protein [Murimonas intestini]MCR1842858.1 ASKHA domain-containing protein [Murimonas intestini]MCR1868177.1 ASKHA domain-containing protein [Murimonas intestini]MCR1885331.1 ASKHA domain-containing protein [Murimonas intestini]